MNAIVLIALRRPYTFVVLGILILIFGGRAVLSTPTDIFPNIGIPVVAGVWTYNGLTPEDMSGRVVFYYERALTTTVSNIEHIESQSLYGLGIVKIFFHPGTDVAAAQAQVASVSQTVLKQLPAGITPPPHIELQRLLRGGAVPPGVSGATDRLAAIRYRHQSHPVRCWSPYRASPSRHPTAARKAISKSIWTQQALLAHGLSAQDVARALGQQNIVLPAGDQKIGALDFLVETNATPVQLATFNSLPIKQVGRAVVTVGDVAACACRWAAANQRRSGARPSGGAARCSQSR